MSRRVQILIFVIDLGLFAAMCTGAVIRSYTTPFAEGFIAAQLWRHALDLYFRPRR